MRLIDELKWRGLIFDVTDEEVGNVLENEKVTFYVGVDPTANSIHVGHLISYLVSKRLQDRGHHPIRYVTRSQGASGIFLYCFWGCFCRR